MKLVCCALGLALAACTPENGPTMRPGDDCLRCHGGSSSSGQGEGERHATPWSLAGTVYATSDAAASAGIEGADVTITDANGSSFRLTSNLVGNFYVADAVAFPLHVCVVRSGATTCMTAAVSDGACNRCHTLPPQEDAPGRIAAP